MFEKVHVVMFYVYGCLLKFVGHLVAWLHIMVMNHYLIKREKKFIIFNEKNVAENVQDMGDITGHNVLDVNVSDLLLFGIYYVLNGRI